MAVQKNTTSKAKTAAEKEAPAPVTVQEKPVETPKKYKDDDKIPCVSVTSGLLIMVGARTGAPYRWLDAGDVIEVDYADLMAEIRSRGSYVYKPRFVIDDEALVEQHKDLVKLYESLYSRDDLREILDLPVAKLKDVVGQLPESVKDTLKSMAVTEIERGHLDSIQKIKALDEVFGTQMLIKLTS